MRLPGLQILTVTEVHFHIQGKLLIESSWPAEGLL